MKRQPTPQHITWFLDLYRNNQLDLNPSYQRKSVWTAKDRRFFLDTIFRNYPAPPIFFHREINDQGFATYHVVDGKQRLETILNFANGKIAIDKNFGDDSLNGKKFKDLNVDNKRKFWDYILIVDFIDDIGGTNIKEVFDRVNRNSKNLEQQELRHARFDGWFINEVESESEQQLWWDLKINTRAKEKRMKNVQFISELLFVIIDKKIVGFSQDYLDEMYAKYEVPEETDENFNIDEFREKKERIKMRIYEMNSHNTCIEQFGKTATNFYTLWALIVLNESRLPTSEVLADKYAAFMTQVQILIDSSTPDDYTASVENVAYFDYYINSKGASTEPPQRQARLSALELILS